MNLSGLLALVFAAVAVEANLHHAERDVYGGHAHYARRLPKRSGSKRCKVRSSSLIPSSTPVAEAAVYAPTSTPTPTPTPTSTSSSWAAPVESSSVNAAIMAATTPVASAAAGLLAVTSSTCGPNGATGTHCSSFYPLVFEF